MTIALETTGLEKRFGALRVTRGLSLKIEQGGKVTEQKVNAEVRDMVPGGSHAGHASHGEHKH